MTQFDVIILLTFTTRVDSSDPGNAFCIAFDDMRSKSQEIFVKDYFVHEVLG